MDDISRTILWRNDRFSMYEYCSLHETGQRSRFEGIVLTKVEEKPLRIAYQVACNEKGLTISADVDVAGGLGERHIQLTADEHRGWYWDGKELPECRGLADVDLGFTPATNSLPIRRLGLEIGETQALTTT